MESADLVRVLSSLQHRANSKKATSKFSWDAISKIYQNVTGQDLDYDTFKMIFDKDPNVKNLVQNFSSYGITIKTKEKEPPTELGQKPQTNNADAVRAANNVLQQPG
jgi:hypothetical protein